MMKKIKIALGDLRHKTLGRHSVFMPLGIGYIAAYSLKRLGRDAADIRLYTDADDIMAGIERMKPDIVGLSNYSWNS